MNGKTHGSQLCHYGVSHDVVEGTRVFNVTDQGDLNYKPHTLDINIFFPVALVHYYLLRFVLVGQ